MKIKDITKHKWLLWILIPGGSIIALVYLIPYLANKFGGAFTTIGKGVAGAAFNIVTNDEQKKIGDAIQTAAEHAQPTPLFDYVGTAKALEFHLCFEPICNDDAVMNLYLGIPTADDLTKVASQFGYKGMMMSLNPIKFMGNGTLYKWTSATVSADNVRTIKNFFIDSQFANLFTTGG